MTTPNYRALCAELIEAVLSDDSRIDSVEIARRARAALAAEPVLQPLADAGKVETLRELALKELDAWVEERNGLGESIICDGLRVRLIKAALAAEPVGPTDEALANFTAWFCRNYPGPDTIIHKPEWHAPRVFQAAAHALARWGRP